ncbi:low molecular weight phosphatase family protein [Roseibium salinum]|uniref:ArsR family transcriptional regulator n=1 Tax=Roseibium salinum TaxID=1604349 RepID=A0ABT3R5X6_9HYPH|nr:ArsR family transcriptional regulator [Roseibium sp. DSM 29163]MCX2724417.1 ArsR family transcriptional regulator [Roseibium sp. DSM 29163]MDN3721563.1 ArsR family transcriptional regulator [Roseibium salinum]
MTKTSVLFLCPDNSLLGPLAEAYLNFKAGGLLRAFSAGIEPAAGLNRNVHRLLSAEGVDTVGLAPKPVGIFLMPHAVIPDRVIYLADMDPIEPPHFWKATTSSHWWSIARNPQLADTFGACADCFLRIKTAIDRLVEPPRAAGKPLMWNVA